MAYIFVFLVIFLAFAFVFGGIVVNYIVAPRAPGQVKGKPYECGEDTIGSTWIQFNIGYYVIGLMFLIFDVETVFLYPWAVAFKDVGFMGLIEISIFVFILLLGLLYAWKKGVFEWV